MAIYQINNAITMLSNASTSGVYKTWLGGKGCISVEGTFGGTTAAMQFLSLNGTDIPAKDVWNNLVTFTAQGQQLFELPPGNIKVTLTGGSPSAMNAYVVGVEQ